VSLLLEKALTNLTFRCSGRSSGPGKLLRSREVLADWKPSLVRQPTHRRRALREGVRFE
jgi:hypothetical protein